MKKTSFPNIKANPSILGFGLMRLPMKGNKIDFEEGKRIVDYAYENGVNYYDTAYGYHDGDSETFAAYALGDKPRDTYYLADKMPGWGLKSVDDTKKIFADQLKKCKVDYFDFYMFHAVSKNFFNEKYLPYAWEYLSEQKQKGAIKHLGFSYHDKAANLPYMLDFYNWDFVQIQYNYCDCLTADAADLMRELETRKIPAVIMEPVRGGSLARLVKEAEDILKKSAPDNSIASWAIKYCMSEPNSMTTTSGMSNFEQVKDNIKTAKNFQPFSAAERETLLSAAKKHIDTTFIPCTACKYCISSCPQKIDIAGVFTAFNEYFRTGDEYGYGLKMTDFGNSGPKGCTACAACEARCPQNVDIAARMTKLKR
jgi:hypothetical protein